MAASSSTPPTFAKICIDWLHPRTKTKVIANFICLTPEGLGNAIINSLPNTNAQGRTSVKDITKNERAMFMAMYKFKAEDLATYYEGFAEKANMLLKDEKVFNIFIFKRLSVAFHYSIVEEERFIPDAIRDLDVDTVVGEILSANGIKTTPCPAIIMPDNLPEALSKKLEIYIRTYCTYPDNAFLLENADKYLMRLGMRLNTKDLAVSWVNVTMMRHYEEAYIQEHKDFSSSYQALLKAAGRNYTADDNKLIQAYEKASGKKFKDTYGGGAGNPYDVEDDEEDVTYNLRNHEISVKHRALLDVELPTKLEMVKGNMVINKPSIDADGFVSVDSVKRLMKDNSMDQDSVEDAVYGIILSHLAVYDAIELTSEEESTSPLTGTAYNMITKDRIKKWLPAAKMCVLVAMHIISQPPGEEGLTWYNSFKAVYGYFIGANRLTSLSKMIYQTNVIQSFCEATPLINLINENNVLKYRLTRLSTPSLIIRAITKVSDTKIINHINPEIFKQYKKFHDAGLPAQIASGPLRVYCKGTVDPMRLKEISPDMMISDLKPIDQPPYDRKIICQAKIILDEFGDKISNWYQGEKAIKESDPSDAIFKFIVSAVKLNMMTGIKDKIDAAYKEHVFEIDGDEEAGDQVKNILSRMAI